MMMALRDRFVMACSLHPWGGRNVQLLIILATKIYTD
jgi:hypothetical protein